MSEPANSDWRSVRRHRRRTERLLPERLRVLTWAVESDYHAQGAIDFVLDRMKSLAAERGIARTVEVSGCARLELLPVHQRAILRDLEADETFVGELRHQIQAQIRLYHVMGVDPQGRILLPKLGEVPVPDGPVLRVRSSLRLGSAPALESEPEGWDYWCVERIVKEAARNLEPEFDDIDVPVGVLCLGSNAGGLARCVEARASSVPRIRVTERDWIFGTPTDLPCATNWDLGSNYDAVVLVMPSPASGGASTHRRIYKPRGSITPFDPASLGPTRWRESLDSMLAEISSRLAPDGTGYVLLPSSVRTETGYRHEPELLVHAERALDARGLKVVERFDVVELEPVRWPFVAARRPKRASFTVRRVA